MNAESLFPKKFLQAAARKAIRKSGDGVVGAMGDLEFRVCVPITSEVAELLEVKHGDVVEGYGVYLDEQGIGLR